jgi:tRNA pseudouridine32 synthase/23S rRNA pseudouridine746 synthase
VEIQAVRVLTKIETLLVIEKPPNVYLDRSNSNKEQAVQPGSTIYEQLRVQFPQDQFPYLTHCHQLDYPTSGLLLFALAKPTASEISGCFASRKISKTYRALVPDPRFREQDKVNNPFFEAQLNVWKLLEEGREVLIQFRLGTDPNDPNGFKQVAFLDHQSGREAVTRMRLISAGSLKSELQTRVWLVELYPVTGRTHQLRVHLLSIGLPIIGDVTYSDESRSDSRLMLHAYRLSFPYQGENYEIETPDDPLQSYMFDTTDILPIEPPIVSKVLWKRRKYACVLPYIRVKKGSSTEAYFLLTKLPKKRKDFSKKKGFWWGFFWKELSSSDCDIAEGASSAFQLNMLSHFKEDCPLSRSSYIRKGNPLQLCVVPDETKLSAEYPLMMNSQSALFVVPLTDSGFMTLAEFEVLKSKIPIINQALVENDAKSGKDKSRIGGVSVREVGLFKVEDVIAAAQAKTGLILDEWLEHILRSDSASTKLSELITSSALPTEIDPEEYGISHYESGNLVITLSQ